MTTPSRPNTLSEINVTPFVDVLLVLLIIFMVITPVAPRALDTALPSKASPGPTNPPPALVIVIEATGFTLNQQPVPTLPDLAARLSDAFAARTDRTVFVRAAEVVPYGAVVEVMDVATGAGARRIGILGER